MNNKISLTRRNLLKTGAGAAAILAAPALLTKGMAAETLTVSDYGGVFEQGFRLAFYDSFEKEFGVKINTITVAPDPVPQYKMSVDTKSYTSDIIMLAPEHVVRLTKLGNYLEDLNLKIDDPENYVKGSVTDKFAGVEVYALALGYRKDVLGDNAPKNWAEFWDADKFKGRRGLWRSPVLTLELALLADGVGIDSLYPLDIDRAFKSLDKIRSSVDVWWTSGAQATQLIQSGELDMMSIWSTRAQAAIDGGAPVGISWDQGFYNIDGWTIPMGGAKVDLSRKFIQYCMNAERQSKFTDVLSAGPVNIKAYDYIKKERGDLLPTAPQHVKGLRLMNAEYWGANQDKLTEQFEKWMLG
jgi:putative spermidine/putrescine transport system substrate-binding protein